MNHGFYGLPGLRPDVAAGPWGNANISLRAIHNGSQLTISARARDGGVIGSGGGSVVAFPNADQSVGDTKLKIISQPVSPLVIASGSTLGFASGVSGRLWVVLVDDISGPALAVVNCRSGKSIHPLGQDDLLTSLALSGGASTSHQFYSARAVTARPYIILGYLTWETPLATAGTWNARPDRVRLYGPGVKLPGGVVQTQKTYFGGMTTGAITVIPSDNTPPEKTEGNQLMTREITPRSAANLLNIRAFINYSYNSSSIKTILALLQDTATQALATSTSLSGGSSTGLMSYALEWDMVAGQIASTTFRLNAGPQSTATVFTFNGEAGNAFYGGTLASFMSVTELMA